MSARRPALGCVGSGRLAAALLPLWKEAGWEISALAGRNRASVRKLSGRLGIGTSAGTAALDDSPPVVLLAVPDEQIADVADRMARRGSWRHRIVLHHAGAHGPELLLPLERAGAATGVLHPLQVMPSDARATIPAGSRARCEGAPRAEKIARRLARDAGFVPLPAALKWDATSRTEYHLAATLAANDLVALLVSAARLLESSGIASAPALAALLPLAHGALDQLATTPPGEAVSGPIPRGDLETLAAHFKRLESRDRELFEAHRLLSSRVLDLALEEGRLSDRAQKRFRRLLSAGRNPKPAV